MSNPMQYQVSASQPRNSNLGDEWFNPTNNKSYKLIALNGTSVGWQETTSLYNTAPPEVDNTVNSTTVLTPTITGTLTVISQAKFLATGGTITINGRYTVHTFTTTGTFTPSTSGFVEYIVVGGGGGGGGTGGGGGGGGQFRTGTGFKVLPIGYIVTVGTGGAGGLALVGGSTGTDSTFSSITSLGGGGGGSGNTTIGLTGGNGGGGSGNAGATFVTMGQGFSGGKGSTDGSTYIAGGGGGGSSTVGVDSTLGVGGYAGIGTASPISGTIVTYSGGGGGGTNLTGALGGVGNNLGGTGNAAATTLTALAGMVNTGGGGGGSNNATYSGGAGGSGIVIIRYLTQNTDSSFAVDDKQGYISMGSSTPPAYRLDVTDTARINGVLRTTTIAVGDSATLDAKAVIHSEGHYSINGSNWAGSANKYYGGGANFTGQYGNPYGAGAAYTYGAENAINNGYLGGQAGGYFKGTDGYRWAGGGAGVVAIGGGVVTPGQSGGAGAGIYARAGINANGTTGPWAGYFEGNIGVTGNVGLGISSPTAPLHIVSSANFILKVRGATTGQIGGFYSDATQISFTENAGSNTYAILPASNALSLSTSAVERMRIDSSGVVILSQGQIKFPATQVPSADANTLDDYEEGTWSPVFWSAAGGTGTNQGTGAGTYTKIGNTVRLSWYRGNTGVGNSLSFTGVPFACADDRVSGISSDGAAIYVASGGVTIVNFRGSGDTTVSRGNIVFQV